MYVCMYVCMYGGRDGREDGRDEAEPVTFCLFVCFYRKNLLSEFGGVEKAFPFACHHRNSGQKRGSTVSRGSCNCTSTICSR